MSSIITSVDFANETFKKLFQKLRPEVQKEAKQAIGQLTLLDIAAAPKSLHLHTLTALKATSAVNPKNKVSIYTIHLTKDDKWKASFTFENGIAFMRVCGEHDWVDKNPA